MSYLKNNNNRVIVDAILTKYGQQKLATEGTLGITKFRLADDEVDYGLYNILHPQGSEYFDSAIVNMPTIEVLPNDSYIMKYPLFTPSTEPDIVPKISLSYNSQITSSVGINTYSTYTITPNLIPTPATLDYSKFWYNARLVCPYVYTWGGRITLSSQTMPSRIKSKIYTMAEQWAFHNTTNMDKYAIGDTFSINVTQFPTATVANIYNLFYVYLVITTTGANSIASALRIKIANRSAVTVGLPVINPTD